MMMIKLNISSIVDGMWRPNKFETDLSFIRVFAYLVDETTAVPRKSD